MTSTSKAAALFASSMQPSEHATGEQIIAAIRDGLLRHGGLRGVVAYQAAEYGDHPETAAARMRWARDAVAGTSSWTFAAA